MRPFEDMPYGDAKKERSHELVRGGEEFGGLQQERRDAENDL